MLLIDASVNWTGLNHCCWTPEMGGVSYLWLWLRLLLRQIQLRVGDESEMGKIRSRGMALFVGFGVESECVFC